MARVKGKREKAVKHRGLRIVLRIILLLLAIVIGYVAYVFISYHRIDDNLQLEVNNPDDVAAVVPTGSELSLHSWNIGFGAYVQDYTFFMDGGKESRARSKDILNENMENIIDELDDMDSDFYAIQEVDFDSTRTYHVDEAEMIKDEFDDYANTFAQNYDSPYLFWPIIKPHGASKSGLLTMSKYEMASSLRRSLPIQTDYAKLIDLDRCYDVVKYPADNGKQFVLINLHLSAYTTDPTIADKQLDMLYEQIETEYESGNYVICVGDYNKDLVGDNSLFNNTSDESWAKPFKKEALPKGFSLVKNYDPANLVPSCRNCDIPYVEGETFVITVDGFIVSDNIEVVEAETLDKEFMYSDHNPIKLVFKLKK